jgi:hypothetical protein
VEWKPFKYGERSLDLSHLNSFEFEFIVAAKDGKPEQRYVIRVDFGLHCFTADRKDGEAYSSELEYSDSRETRLFDFNRYQLSMRLPGIVRRTVEGKCFHGLSGNFYARERLDSGESYYVFFKLSRGSEGQHLTVFVVSAYVPDLASQPTAKSAKPIRFSVLAYNTSVGKPIRRPR